MKIPFHKPYSTGNEVDYINSAISSGHLSGNGIFTKKNQQFLQAKYGYKKAFLTTSCTDALEMSAMLLDIAPGDEVIIPSFTFVSTALAFVRQGANIIFADSSQENPNIDITKLEKLITPRTRAIVVVHYAGISCQMDEIMEIANKFNLYVVEDAAQAIDAYYKGRVLGGIGHLGCISFHETKNIHCGEGGCLIINDEKFIKRAEILWEKGTNRADFFRGEINKYGWVDIGSSFLPSELNAAFLLAQLEKLDEIQTKRKMIYNHYYESLKELEENELVSVQKIPEYATNNGHMFYLICKSEIERGDLISYLKGNEIYSVFHYQSLHQSTYYKNKYSGNPLPMSDLYTDRLLRLPMYYALEKSDIEKVSTLIKKFYYQKRQS